MKVTGLVKMNPDGTFTPIPKEKVKVYTKLKKLRNAKENSGRDKDTTEDRQSDG